MARGLISVLAGLCIGLVLSCSPADIWQSDIRSYVEDGMSAVLLERWQISSAGMVRAHSVPEHENDLHLRLINPRNLPLELELVAADPELYEGGAEPHIEYYDTHNVYINLHPALAAENTTLRLTLHVSSPQVAREFPPIELNLPSRFPDSSIEVAIDIANPDAHVLSFDPTITQVDVGSEPISIAPQTPSDLVNNDEDWEWYVNGAGPYGNGSSFDFTPINAGDYIISASVTLDGIRYSGEMLIRVVHPGSTTYAIFYDANGGSDAPEYQPNIEANTSVFLSGDKPTRAGYEFTGWKKQGTGTTYQAGEDFLMPSYNVVLVAQWEPIVLEVTELNVRPAVGMAQVFWTDPDSPLLDYIRVVVTGGEDLPDVIAVPGEETAMLHGLSAGVDYTITVYAHYTTGDAEAVTAPLNTPTEPYHIGGPGPAGGYIFYINANYEADGWKYLEAAGSGWTDIQVPWGPIGIHETSEAIGSGLENTRKIVEKASDINPESAIGRVTTLNLNFYKDWFLPSQLELVALYQVYVDSEFDVGDFNTGEYWTSTEDTTVEGFEESAAETVRFSNGDEYSFLKTEDYRFRPVRRF